MSQVNDKPKYDFMTAEDLDKLFEDRMKTERIRAIEKSLEESLRQARKITEHKKKRGEAKGHDLIIRHSGKRCMEGQGWTAVVYMYKHNEWSP
jgi:hypothetical protein